MTSKKAVPRLRMFSGPNGSGKSTIKSLIPANLLGTYLNPDEIETKIKQLGYLELKEYKVQASETEITSFLERSTLLEKSGLLPAVSKLKISDNRIDFSSVNTNAYFASVAADLLRHKLLRAKRSFSFETVMSSPDKIQFLEKAKSAQYRNYLYFVSTDDPEINIQRVEHRVREGGHDVPKDKITSRYYRTMEMLRDAIKYTDRAYIFDNSGSKALLLAEITNAKKIELKTGSVPRWFIKYVLDKIT
jgi:predicted ABC-type ATPase